MSEESGSEIENDDSRSAKARAEVKSLLFDGDGNNYISNFEMFQVMRGLPLSDQKELLMKMYGDPKLRVPHGKEVAEMIARINNIPWFTPHQEVPEEYIKERVQLAQERLGIQPRPLREVGTWNAAMSAFGDTYEGRWAEGARQVLANLALRNEKIGDVAVDVYSMLPSESDWAYGRDAVPAVSRIACDAVRWTAAQDKMQKHEKYDKGNAFEPLLDLCEKGLWPVGLTRALGTYSEFVVMQLPVAEPTIQPA